ncbi:MAG: WS/DGAT/MGAT family O-acyltransferase [Rhodoferax sp.]
MGSVRLNPLDAAWILTESRATPNHVGGLLQFKLPPHAPRDWMRQLMADFRSHRHFTAPWNRKLKVAFQFNPVPEWVEDRHIDLEYHVRHAALPWPGGERELGELVGRLQSTPLDLSRPPWECTIIEGLEGERFALFIKMHHSLIDGVSGVKLLQGAMSADRAESVSLPPFWALGKQQRERHAHPAHEALVPTVAHAVAGAVQELKVQARNLPELAVAFGKMAKSAFQGGEGMAVPFDAPLSVLNGRVREKRRFATQRFALERLRTLAHAADCTVNDVVLALCGGALRRFLQERGALPTQSLTAGIPVSVRPKGDEGTGNAISFIISTLATDVADAQARLAAIRASVRRAKDHVQSLPRQAMLQYTVLLMAPTILTLLTGVGGRTRPMFNITISNVPGPETPLYFRGAELVATYPASIVTHGQALNITCQSYAGYMNFGFTGCHTSVPSLQKLAVYTAEALQELEAAVQAQQVSRDGAVVVGRLPKAPAERKRRSGAAGAPAAEQAPAQAEAVVVPLPTASTPAQRRARKVPQAAQPLAAPARPKRTPRVAGNKGAAKKTAVG